LNQLLPRFLSHGDRPHPDNDTSRSSREDGEGGFVVDASVSYGSPISNSNVTVYGRLLVDGVGQGNEGMAATWHNETATPTGTATTRSDSTASGTGSGGSATVGNQVNLGVQIGGYSAQTWSTPQ